MGRYLFGMSGSSPGFLRMGLTAATLSAGGTWPVEREEFIVAVMRGPIVERQVLTKVEGIGSRAQVAVLMPEICF